MQLMREAINTCLDTSTREHLKCIRPNYLLRYVNTKQIPTQVHQPRADIRRLRKQPCGVAQSLEIKILAAARANHAALFAQFPRRYEWHPGEEIANLTAAQETLQAYRSMDLGAR